MFHIYCNEIDVNGNEYFALMSVKEEDEVIKFLERRKFNRGKDFSISHYKIIEGEEIFIEEYYQIKREKISKTKEIGKE